MAFITRLSRLFSADLHAVLDQVEEPEIMLRQAIREMEKELSVMERNSDLFDQELRRLNRMEQELQQKLLSTEEELDLAFETDNQELSRCVVRHKLELQTDLRGIQAKSADKQALSEEHNQQFKENQRRLQTLQQKASLFTHSHQPSADEQWRGERQNTISEQDIELAWLREQRKRRAS